MCLQVGVDRVLQRKWLTCLLQAGTLELHEKKKSTVMARDVPASEKAFVGGTDVHRLFPSKLKRQSPV